MTEQKILTVFMFQQSKVYLLLTVGHLVSSSLVVWVLISGYSWLPSHTSHHLLTATVRLAAVPTDWPQLILLQVLGYLCGLQTVLCAYQSAREEQYTKIEESSTNFTLHDTVTTRAVTADTIIPPRPQPPPAPRPAVRVQHDNYQSPPHSVRVQHDNYQSPPHSQHNHNGARQVLPPVRSVSQHRLGSGQEMQDYYELRARQPDTSLDCGFTPASTEQQYSIKETGAIPKKKKKTVPLPSPLTIHPDEIIALPMDDLSPHLSASTQKPQHNSAH